MRFVLHNLPRFPHMLCVEKQIVVNCLQIVVS